MPYEFQHHQANAASQAGDRIDHRPRGSSPHRHRRLAGILALCLAIAFGVWALTSEAPPPEPDTTQSSTS